MNVRSVSRAETVGAHRMGDIQVDARHWGRDKQIRYGVTAARYDRWIETRLASASRLIRVDGWVPSATRRGGPLLTSGHMNASAAIRVGPISPIPRVCAISRRTTKAGTGTAQRLIRIAVRASRVMAGFPVFALRGTESAIPGSECASRVSSVISWSTGFAVVAVVSDPMPRLVTSGIELRPTSSHRYFKSRVSFVRIVAGIVWMRNRMAVPEHQIIATQVKYNR